EDSRRGETTHLEVRREPDAELLAVAAPASLGLLLTQRFVIEQLECRIEVRVVVARVDGEPRRDRLRELAQEIEPADLDRILPELARQRVDRAFDRVRRLGPSRPAVCVGGRRRRKDASAVELVCGDVVRAGVQPGAEQRRARGDELEVRTEADGQLRPYGADLSVRRRGELDLLDLVA